MEESVKKIIMKRLESTAEALRKNNMAAYVCDTKEEALEIAKQLIPEGASVGMGGSESMKQCGVAELVRSGNYNFIDRSAAENVLDCYREMYSADVFLCSSNAVTERGELYNVDGNSNRISMIAFGPSKVVMVVGYNKIVRDIDEAARRVKQISAPANCVRLECKTYCAEKGHCIAVDGDCFEGCGGETICCNYLISRKQRQKDRINVILVAEELGY